MNSPMGPRKPSSEAGFALIEVIVAAAVLAIVALAVLSGIDGATSSTTREKARAIAANLAEQDQERLRAMPVDQLRNPPQTGDTVVDGVTYNVKSEAKFITDDLGGEPTCGSASTQVQYLHIVTTVTSAVVGQRIPPVSVDSLVSPTTDFAEGHGALGLRIVDRSGTKGVAGGVTVSATSPSYNPPNESTDPNGSGCAVFDGIPVGAYTLTVDQPGYVGRDLQQKQTVNGTAVRKTVSFVNLQYDKAVTIRGAFSTHTPGKPFSTADLKPTTSTYLSATNGINVGMLRTVKSTPAATTIDSAGLYPFTENMYAMFAGECKYTSPDTYVSNYFGTKNTAAALFGDPAKPQPQLATVYEPPLNVRVMYRSNGYKQPFLDDDIIVYAKLQKPSGSTDSCDEDSYTLYTTGWGANSAASWGSAPRTSASYSTYNKDHWLTSVKGSFDPGMPFGKYRFCVVDTVAKKYGVTTSDYNNTSPDGDQNRVGHLDRQLVELQRLAEPDEVRVLVMSARLRQEDGFTLPELLTTMMIGLILVLATLTLVEVTMRRTGESQDRVEALQGGRLAMDTMTRELRSRVCLPRVGDVDAPQFSIDAASPDSITVFTDMRDTSTGGTPVVPSGYIAGPDKRTLTYVPDAGQAGQQQDRRVRLSGLHPQRQRLRLQEHAAAHA